MKIKKICSFLVACMLLCGSVGVMESQTNTVYAMPSQYVADNTWLVWGEESLYNEIRLAKGRICPQGVSRVILLIEKCIRQGRKLRVTKSFFKWYYEIL